VSEPRATPNQGMEPNPEESRGPELSGVKETVLPLYEEYLRLGLSNSEAAAILATRLKEDDDTVREALGLPPESIEVTLAAFRTGMSKLKQITRDSQAQSHGPIGIPEDELTKAFNQQSRKSGINP
jgi:hypothetical protein